MKLQKRILKISALQKLQILFYNMEKDHISEFSAQCAYYVILSFIPFFILLITLIQYTNIESEQLFYIISKVIPASMKDIILNIIKEIYSKSIGTISVSLIFTLLSADRGLFALNKGLSLIYKKTDTKEKTYIYLRIRAIIQTILFIIIIMILLIVMVFGKTIVSMIKDNLGGLKNYNVFSEILTRIGILVILFFMILFMYKFMSGYKVKLKKQVLGSIFSSVTISIVSLVFSKFLEIFRGFSITYGSLTTLMLIMMWTYSCFFIIFIGAEINNYNSR